MHLIARNPNFTLLNNSIMDVQDRIENSNSYNSFRMGLDLGMGVIYIALGLFFILAKYSAMVDLPMWAYVLGGLMTAFGLFRVYRGGKSMIQRKSMRGQ